MKYENARVGAARVSPNMAVALAAKRLVAEGRHVRDLSLGEPDFEPPAHVREAACRAIMGGAARYTAPAGITSLREAAAEKFRRDNALEFHPDEITVANGAKQILFNAFLATLEPGDEVIVPVPGWSSYADMVTICGGAPRLVECGEGDSFKLTADLLREAVSDRTRWLILCSPGNPTGAVYSQADYSALAVVLEERPRILLACDEIYEHIVFGPASFVSFGTACPGLRERTLLVNGVSKAYSMTGWRVGYAAGPKTLIAALNKIQSQSVTSVCAISQVAAEAALCGPQDYVADVVAQYGRRRDLVVKAIADIPRLRMMEPEGAFYGFVNVSQGFGRADPKGAQIGDDVKLTTWFLQQYGVATVPGRAFFSPAHIRLSFAASEADLAEAMNLLGEMMASLRPFRD